MLTAIGETWVITRTVHRPAIQQQIRAAGESSEVRFVYLDLPARLLRWEQRERGVRLYYLLWQFAAVRKARRLARRERFDLVWHLTLANAWIGSTACLLKIPFVYGPVGGGVGTPWKLAGTLGIRGILFELARTGVRACGRYLNPLARASWRRASLILTQNEETTSWLPQNQQRKASVFPHVVLDRMPDDPNRRPDHVLLFAGRLIGWKGASLAIRALERLPDWRLIVCGDGPEGRRLQRLAARLWLDDRVEFRGWVNRAELLRTMREEASVFVFPSLHDEAGWVVVEAMASGLPVVCLDLGGPPVLACNAAVAKSGRPAETAARIAEAITNAARMTSEQPRDCARRFLIEIQTERLKALLAERVNRDSTAD